MAPKKKTRVSPQSDSLPSPLAHHDLLPHILRYADRVTLARCMRASWSFFDAASPYLYDSITVVPETADNILRGSSTGPMIFSDCTEREMKRSLLNRVRVLDVREHQGCTACRRWSETGINFPSMQVMRTWTQPDGSGGGFYGCPWLRTFSPAKVVMRNERTLPFPMPNGRSPGNRRHEPKKIIITTCQLRDLREVNKYALNLRQPHPEDLEDKGVQAVIIFWTDRPEDIWDEQHQPMSSGAFDNILQQLALCVFKVVESLIISESTEIRCG